MTSLGPAFLMNFASLIPPEWFAERSPEHGPGSGAGIYSGAVVTWLMIVQRLHPKDPKGTLHAALGHLSEHWPAAPLPACKHVREHRISKNPGGYCKAQHKMPTMPTLIASQVCDQIFEKLQATLPGTPGNCSHPAYLLDGSSLETEHTADLVKAFPPAHNQFGVSHWPVLRLAVMPVMHNLANGLALRPAPRMGTDVWAAGGKRAGTGGEANGASATAGDRRGRP